MHANEMTWLYFENSHLATRKPAELLINHLQYKDKLLYFMQWQDYGYLKTNTMHGPALSQLIMNLHRYCESFYLHKWKKIL